MRIGSSATGKGSVRSRRAWAFWLALTVAVVVGAFGTLGALQTRQAPRFAGKVIPDPPNQGEPWTAPPTKLPKFLVNATGTLFEQGVADPRGCEYRQVEIGNGLVVKARGFVLPERADAPGRFVVCWDGLVYPALSVGEPIDLDRDIKELAADLQRGREDGSSSPRRRGLFWGFSREGQSALGVAGVDDHAPIKLCLLLRLGRADLAETLFAAGTSWTPEPRKRDLTDYGISYLTLATDWARSVFSKLIHAHARGDDVIALDAASKLAKFRDLATAKADAMGFPEGNPQNRFDPGPVSRFPFLTQLDDLLRDQERRAWWSRIASHHRPQLDGLLRDHERKAEKPARGPIPKKGGDPSDRIAALIRDLDQINEPQMMSPGAASPGNSPLVRDLVAEGDPAVAPLLKVLESDKRLTRSVSRGRGFPVTYFVHPVSEAAFAALTRILKTREFENERFSAWKPPDPAARKALAASIREFWEKTRSIPLAERWYRTLLDDSAGQARWLEAASGIISPVVAEGQPLPKPGTRPLQGEPLREGRDPSVSALILRRAGEIERMGNPLSSHDQGFAGACQMGAILVSWDEQAALPLLKDLCKKCRARSDRWREQKNPQNADQSLASSLAKFTQERVRLGDVVALDEYAAWLRTTSPKMLEYGTFEALRPLLAQPDHPALASAARWLFNDPKSPWVPLLPEARGEPSPFSHNLFASSLIVVAGFREGVLAGLADKTPLGTIRRNEKGTIERKIKNVPTTNYGSANHDLEGFAAGVEYPFRHCDDLAWKLSGLEGCPRCELFWPESRRDEAVAACVAYLKRFGGRFTTEAPPGVHDFPDPKAHLKLPTLEKPATRADVASARAIFSLEGQGEEVRVVSLPGYPQPAHWVTLKDQPVDRTEYPSGITRREYDTDGFVWQAEEVRKGDKWERYYGFVGHHVVARAPASEIEFGARSSPWGSLKGGLDARTELVDPRNSGYEPGQPIPVALHLRNRLGVTRSSPMEIVRPDPDGKPALRNGVSLSLRHSPLRGASSGLNRVYPNEVVEPRRDAHFDPGDAARSLAPLEAFEALRFDLNDWFDLTKPGTYRFQVTFAADSGLGEGLSRAVIFQVGDDE